MILKQKSSISVIDEYYKLNGLSLLRNVLFNNVEDEKIRVTIYIYMYLLYIMIFQYYKYY